MNIITALRHQLVFACIAAHVAIRYFFKLPLQQYPGFIRRAVVLLRAFRHNRPVRLGKGYKLQLYLPAWPGAGFFQALDNKLLRRPPAPTSLVFSMTGACAYHCPHCYQKLERGADILETLLLDTLRQTLDAGVSFYNIEGGEPFLRFERLLRVLECVRGRAEAWVNTTGYGVSPAMLQKAREAGMQGIMASIHSCDPAAHDAFTGVPGSFAAARTVLTSAAELGLGTAINSVLSEDEIQTGGIERLMELAADIGVGFVQLIHPKPCGGWLHDKDPMQLERDMLTRIEQAHVYYNRAGISGPALSAQAFEERKDGFGCTAGGIDRFYISATGEVQPCEFLQISFGNIAREDFGEIFQRMRQCFAIPRTGWLCCCLQPEIARVMHREGITTTPLPLEKARELLPLLSTGNETPLYSKMGIYKP